MGRGARRRLENLPDKLREIRDRLGLSQGGLVERLNLTEYLNQAEISDFEHGVREPDLPTLRAYADAAGISTDYLIKDELKLPEKLPGAKRTAGKPQKRSLWGRAKTTNTTTVMLRLQIKSDAGEAGDADRARGAIEKSLLKQLGMKKLKDEYELRFSYQDDAVLDEQVYDLFGAINIEARKLKCSVKVDIREKGSDRYW